MNVIKVIFQLVLDVKNGIARFATKSADLAMDSPKVSVCNVLKGTNRILIQGCVKSVRQKNTGIVIKDVCNVTRTVKSVWKLRDVLFARILKRYQERKAVLLCVEKVFIRKEKSVKGVKDFVRCVRV